VTGLQPMDRFIRMALEAAERGLAEGGIPIGSVLVRDDEVLGVGHNRRVQEKSPILHAEIDALRQAGRQPAQVYRESILYTTLSPCPMCSGAILLYGIPHVVIGENRTYLGEENLLRARGVRVDVLDSEECYELLQRFIREHPELWNEDIGR
jgi:creatinine deaminase